MTNEITINAKTFDVDAIMNTLSTHNDAMFTIAQLSRVVAINEKIARRRLRANASRARNDRLNVAKMRSKKSRANAKYEYDLTRDNVVTMLHVIA